MQDELKELKWNDIKIGKSYEKLPRDFVALDIESMVVSGQKYSIILSIGIAKFENNKFVSSQNIYINNLKNTKKPRHFNMGDVKIQPRKDRSTGISLQNINGGVALGEAIHIVLQLLKDNIVVGHDVVNDLKLLTFNMFRFRLKNYACFANIDYYDTLLNEKNFVHALPDMTLKSLSDYYNVTLLHSHNSEQDATASGFVAIAQEISRNEVMGHNPLSKSLLIIGNGANLHMGWKTKWTDYWFDRRRHLSDMILTTQIQLDDNTISRYLLEKMGFDAATKKAVLNDILEIDMPSEQQYDALIIMYIIQVLYNLENARNTTDVALQIGFIDIFFAWLSLLEGNGVKIKTWRDVEAVLDSSFTRLDNLDGEGQIEISLPEDIATNRTVHDRIQLGFKLALRYVTQDSSKHTMTAERALVETVAFEDNFGNYLRDLFRKDENNTTQYLMFLRDLMVSDTHIGAQCYDVLDFNYEPLAKMIVNQDASKYELIANNIYQPHGNILNGIVIGGNYDGEIKGITSSKYTRQRAIKNLDVNRSNRSYGFDKMEKYHIDLTNYDSIVIYGWSINNVDCYLFKNKTVSQHSISITVMYSENYIDEHSARTQLKLMCDAAGIVIKSLYFREI